MKTTQGWIHWLEHGAGATGLRRAVLVLAALGLTATVAWRQFHGLPTEWTLQQADLARQLARGEGFTTQINHPQTFAVLRARGVGFDPARAYPELHHAPLYALVLAGVFAALPAAAWAHPPVPPDGWWPDYAVLAVNLGFFWVAVTLTWRLGRRLFDERAAGVAAAGVAVSVTLWEQTVVVSGLPLVMTAALAAMGAVTSLEEGLPEAPAWSGAVAGRVAAVAGWGAVLFLLEYSAGLALLVLGGHVAWRLPGRTRGPALVVFVGVVLLVTAPWLARNVAVAGHPLGLAGENLALKADDRTAWPTTRRTTVSAEAPSIDVKKLGNKGLTGLELNLKERLWSGGGLFLTAFFVAGLCYRFRHAPAERLRWVAACWLLVLLAGQPFLGSGESPRLPAYYLAPLVGVFGAGFLFVLLDSQPALGARWRWVVAGLLALQGLPLVRDGLEPRKVHFHYPPYFPNMFMELARHARERFVPGVGLAADVPAGAAWYGDTRVWAMPAKLRDFYVIGVEQHIGALLLTPVTLDRPFFTELAARRERAIQLHDAGGWGGVYAGLVTREMPANFPLSQTQTLLENMVLLTDPGAYRR